MNEPSFYKILRKKDVYLLPLQSHHLTKSVQPSLLRPTLSCSQGENGATPHSSLVPWVSKVPRIY